MFHRCPNGHLETTFELGFIVILGIIYLIFGWALVAAAGHTPLESDAWSMIEIARHMQDGTFPAIDTVRQFKDLDHAFQNIAYPPLVPLILALHGHDGTWAYAIQLQSVIATLALPIIIFVSLSSRLALTEKIYLGLFSVVIMLCTWIYREEILTVCNMSLSLLFLACAFALLLTHDIRWPVAGFLGLAVGLACEARMDAIPIAAVVGVAVIFMSGFRVGPISAYIAALTLGLSPWIISSELNFGIPFVSENTSVIHAAVDHTMRLYGTQANSLMDLVRTKFSNLLRFIVLLLPASPKALWLPTIISICAFFSARDIQARNAKFWVLLAGAASLVGAAATGYGVLRYACPLLLAFALVAGMTLIELARQPGLARAVSRVAHVVTAGVMAATLVKFLAAPPPSDLTQKGPQEVAQALAALQPSESVFSSFPSRPHLFFAINYFDDSAAYQEVYRLGALGHVHAILQPYDWPNLSDEQKTSLFAKLAVNLVASSCPPGIAPQFTMALSGYAGCIYPAKQWPDR